MVFVLGSSLGTKPCVFSGKVAPAGDERYLGCAAVAGRAFWRKSVPPLCSAMTAASYVRRSSMRFLNLGLQIAVEWLHECCHVVLPCALRAAGWQREVANGFVKVSWYRGCVRNIVVFRS